MVAAAAVVEYDSDSGSKKTRPYRQYLKYQRFPLVLVVAADYYFAYQHYVFAILVADYAADSAVDCNHYLRPVVVELTGFAYTIVVAAHYS